MMHKMWRMGLLSLALAMTLGLVRTGSGAILFKAGFEQAEGYSDGAAEQALTTGYIGHAGNQQGWYGERFFSKAWNSHRATVSDDQARGGTQSLRIPRDADYYNYYRHSFPEQTTGILAVEMYVYLESVVPGQAANSNNLIVDVVDRFSNGGEAAGNEYQNHGPTNLRDWANDYGSRVTASTPDRMMYTNNSNGGWPPFYMTQTGIGAQGAWVGRKAVIDLDNATVDYLVDTGSGWVERVTDTTLIGGTSAVIDQLAFYQLSGTNYFTGTTATFVDDVKVEWIPEPASLALLAAGGLLAIRRRKA